MGQLSTHVLDLTIGKPAARMAIDLYRVEGRQRQHLTTAITNADGRTEEPLLSNDALIPAVYELVFHAAAYHRERRENLPDPPFLDEIVIRFGVADAAGRYHIPLLLTPYGYSTYRGS